VRNPFRLKNLDLRFAPAAALGIALLVWSEPAPLSIAIGAPLVIAGVLVRTWAVGHLVKTERFTCTGPYAHLRHPLYLGTLAIGLGMAAMLGSWPGLIGAVCLLGWYVLGYLPRKERNESARLLDRHGSVYARYRAEVPALWPRLRAWRPDDTYADGPAAGGSWRLERFDANNELGAVIAVAFGVALVCGRAAIA